MDGSVVAVVREGKVFKVYTIAPNGERLWWSTHSNERDAKRAAWKLRYTMDD